MNFVSKPYTMSETGLDFTAQSEGFRAQIYDDAGHPAIGYGHDILPGEDFSKGITKEEALSILRKDISKAEFYVNQFVTAPLTQGQIDACVDFCFNIGVAHFKSSTFVKLLNVSNYAGACLQLYWKDGKGEDHGWIYSEGKVSAGLIDRRKGEQKLFNS